LQKNDFRAPAARIIIMMSLLQRHLIMEHGQSAWYFTNQFLHKLLSDK